MTTGREVPLAALRWQDRATPVVVLLLSATVSCWADDGLVGPVASTSRTVPGRQVVSWPADPLMTARQEARILAFLKSDEAIIDAGEISLEELTVELNEHTPAWLDRQALDDLGLRPTELVTLLEPRDQLSLLTRLQNVLKPIDCTLLVRHGLIWITAYDVAEENVYPRVYDVTPLVAFDLQNVSYATTDTDSLIVAITSSINPDGWDVVGGNSSLASFQSADRVLLTATTDTVAHLEVQAYLDALNLATSARLRRATSAQKAIARREFLPQALQHPGPR